jgi:hypothetical protein
MAMKGGELPLFPSLIKEVEAINPRGRSKRGAGELFSCRGYRGVP